MTGCWKRLVFEFLLQLGRVPTRVACEKCHFLFLPALVAIRWPCAVVSGLRRVHVARSVGTPIARLPRQHVVGCIGLEIPGISRVGARVSSVGPIGLSLAPVRLRLLLLKKKRKRSVLNIDFPGVERVFDGVMFVIRPRSSNITTTRPTSSNVDKV